MGRNVRGKGLGQGPARGPMPRGERADPFTSETGREAALRRTEKYEAIRDDRGRWTGWLRRTDAPRPRHPASALEGAQPDFDTALRLNAIHELCYSIQDNPPPENWQVAPVRNCPYLRSYAVSPRHTEQWWLLTRQDWLPSLQYDGLLGSVPILAERTKTALKGVLRERS